MRFRDAIVLLWLPVVVGCGDDSDGARDALIRAADTTRDAGGARITSRGVSAVGFDLAWKVKSAGMRDARGSTDSTSQILVIEGGRSRGQMTTRSIKVGDTVYYKLNGERRWSSFESESSGSLGSSDPADISAIARESDLADVKRAGTDTVRGISTTHYVLTTDLRDFGALSPSSASRSLRDAYQRASQQGGRATLRLDIWVDDDDLIRRVRNRLSWRLTGLDYPPDDETTELFDFGLDERVKRPPARDTERLGP